MLLILLFYLQKIFLSSLQILQIFEYTVFRRQTLWVFPLQKSSMHNALAPQYIKYVFISMRTTIKTTFFSLSFFYLNFQETTQSFKYNKYWICIFILKFEKKSFPWRKRLKEFSRKKNKTKFVFSTFRWEYTICCSLELWVTRGSVIDFEY